MHDPVSQCDLTWRPRHLRVPREDASLLSEPSLAESAALSGVNRQRLDGSGLTIAGRPLDEFRKWAADAVVKAACAYTSERLGRPVAAPSFSRVIVAGHQPTLFHPGVWVKNFALDRLARETDGVGVNLVVDNDTLSVSQVRVPRGNAHHPEIGHVEYDAPRPQQPWEDARVLTPETFDRFAEEVVTAMRPWGIDPIARRMWPAAVRHRQDVSDLLADCITAARARLERDWGLENLELPISRLCDLEPFHAFAGHLLARLPELHGVYNGTLLSYRRLNHVRSRTHPVPDLGQRGMWLEAPFWVWRTGDLRRQPLYGRVEGCCVALSDGRNEFARIPYNVERPLEAALETLGGLAGQGIHLRTRALTTTLFSRLCFGDLFIHGIGGAKYDEMTDRIIEQFFGVEPPAFLTLSATRYLGIAEPFNVTADDEARLVSLLRDLEYNADRHLGSDGIGDLVAEKRRLIAAQHAAQAQHASRRQRRARSRENYNRFRRFHELNAALAVAAGEERQRLASELQTVREQLAANRVIQDRELAFCLFEEARLREFLIECAAG
jgi:hypothetical protein